MALEDLDKTDRKILFELDRNARISYSALGKKIRVAKETVKYRIRSLEKLGIIKGYYTAINFAKIGYCLYRIYLRLQNASPAAEKEIIQYLMHSEKVVVFYRTNGPFHIALAVWARDNYEFESFWNDLKENYCENISDYHFSIITDYGEFSRQYLFPGSAEGKSVFATFRKSETVGIDDLDRKLLVYLSDNARASLTSIAKKLDVSVVTARYHLKNLIKKKVIVGFRIIFNLNALGREYYKVDLWLRRFANAEKIREHIISHPEVAYTERCIISSDLEFDIETRNFDSFISIMESFRKRFPEEIRDYSYYSLIKNYKMRFAPEF